MIRLIVLKKAAASIPFLPPCCRNDALTSKLQSLLGCNQLECYKYGHDDFGEEDTMSRRSLVGVFGFAMLLSSSTWAASLQPGQGDLTINQGQGFQPVNARVDANVGDSVMVGPGGAATVVYDDGCKVAVQPGAITTISPLSPCASGSYAADDVNWGAVALGMGAAALVGVGVYEATKSNSTTTYTAAPASP